MPRGRPRKGLELRLHKGSGVWYVTDPDTRREGYFTKDREESQQRLQQWLLERARDQEREQARQASQGTRPPSVTPADLIVNTARDAFNLYLDWLDQRGKVHSYKTTKDVAAEFGSHVPLQARLDTLSKKDFRAYRDALWQKVEREKLKRSYGNRRIRIVRAAFRRAYRESDYMEKGEAILAMLSILETRAEKDAGGAQPISPDEFHAIAGADDAQWKAIVYLAMNCALGNTDIANLERSDLDLEKGMLHLDRSKTEERTQRPRHTPLWPETLEVLRAHLAKNRSRRLVFTTVRGVSWVRYSNTEKNDELSKKFRKITKSLKLRRRGLSFYSLRHTAAEWAADTPGVGKTGVKLLLGHAEQEMWGKYVTKTPKRLQTAVDAVRRRLFNGQDDQESSDDASTSGEQSARDQSVPAAEGDQGSPDRPEEKPE